MEKHRHEWAADGSCVGCSARTDDTAPVLVPPEAWRGGMYDRATGKRIEPDDPTHDEGRHTTTHDMREGLGRVAFEAYGDAVSWTAYNGQPMPQWPEVSEAIREGWRSAAMAVRERCVA